MSDTSPIGNPEQPQQPSEPTPPAAPEPPAAPPYQAPSYTPPGYESAPQPGVFDASPPPFQNPGPSAGPTPGYPMPGSYQPPMPPAPPVPGYQAAYGGVGPSPVAPKNAKALTGFILSLIGAAATFLTFFTLSIVGLPLGIVGVILSHLGLHELKTRTNQSGKGMATAGLIIGYITVLVSLIAMILFVVLIIVGASNNCDSSGAGQATCDYHSSSSFGTDV